MGLALSARSKDGLTESRDLDDLVRRSGAGDADAFDAIVERYYNRVYRLTYRMLRNTEMAEDATQEIFLKAWRGISRFRQAARFTTWLHAIAVNHCLNAAKRRNNEAARIAPIEDMDTIVESRLCPSIERKDSFEPDWDRRLAVHEAIARLPARLRSIVTLYFFADYTIKEIAVILDMPSTTVFQRLRSATDRLGAVLADMEDR